MIRSWNSDSTSHVSRDQHMDGQHHQPARRARTNVMRWFCAALLVGGLASCDRKPSEPTPAPAVETEDGSAGTVGGKAATARPSKFSSNAGLLAGLDEALGRESSGSSISGPATAAVSTTEPGTITEPVESDTIEDKPTSTDAPDRVEPTTGVPSASASTRTEKPATIEPVAPSATPSGPLALGGIDPLRIGDRVQVQTKGGAWVAGKIINVQIDGTYDVEHDGVIERGLGDAKLRTQR